MAKSLKDKLIQFNCLKKYAYRELNNNRLEATLDYAFAAFTYAWTENLGILSDNEWEDILQAVGEKIKKSRKSQIRYDEWRRKPLGQAIKIAHIASFLQDVGGHSKILNDWIKIFNDISEKQIIYITNVNNTSTEYSGMRDFLDRNICVKKLSCDALYTDRIVALADFIENDSPDVIILHINPNDVIAVTLLHVLCNNPRIVFFNHADHVFWIGKKAIDQLIEFRSISAKYSTLFRGIAKEKIFVIPLTTDIKPVNAERAEYGVPEDATLSISVGSFYKVIEKGGGKYFRAINELLLKFPTHYHIFVTDKPEFAAKMWRSNHSKTQDRFISIGPFADLSPVYGIADFLIETFPLCGCTVRVEAMACKLPIVAYRNEEYDILSECDALPQNYCFRFRNESELVLHSAHFISNLKVRQDTGVSLYQRYCETMRSDRICHLWKKVLDANLTSGNRIPGEYPLEIKQIIDRDYVYRWREQMSSNRISHSLKISRLLLNLSLAKQTEFNFGDKLKFCYGDIFCLPVWIYKSIKGRFIF